MEQAAKFAESTQILMNVSEFTDVSAATDTLISAVQAFGYTADTSMKVVDLLNTIGNNYAISTADLAKSLTKSSASLVAAGGDLAEAAALTATANAIIQDADSVGTALKTTSLRLRGTDAKVLEEEGLDAEGSVTSKSKLQGKVKALSGVDILTESGEYKSTYEILSQIADVWEDISDIDQAALLELISGKRNSSVIAAILQSPEALKAAYEDAQNAAGSAMEENEKYMESIQGHIDQFTNALQTMWNNALDGDVVKGFVDLGTTLIKIVDTLGLIPTILLSIGAFKGFNYLFKGFNVTQIIKDLSTVTMGMEIFDATTRKAAMTTMFDRMQKDLASSSLVQYAIKTGLATTAQVGQMTATQLLGLSFKALGVAIWESVAAMIAFLFTNPVGWAILAAGAIFGVVKLFDAMTISAEEASEQLKETKISIASLEGELDGLKTELDEAKEKLAELLALPHLSLMQQEEVDRLEKTIELLERQIKLKERQIALEEAKLIEDAEETIETKFSNKGQNYYAFDEKKGIIKDDGGHIGRSGEQVFEKAVEAYEKRAEDIKAAQDIVLNWDESSWLDKFKVTDGSNYLYDKVGSLESKEKWLEAIEELEAENVNIAKSIEDFFNDPDYANLSYGMSDEIDDFLDTYNLMQAKWETVLYGDIGKASAIKDLWGSNATEEMNKLKSEIDKIMATDDSWDDKNTAIQELIGGIDTAANGYEHLNSTMQNLGITVQDIADYFTVLNGEFNSNTPEGLMAQYAKGIAILRRFQQMDDDEYRDNYVKTNIFDQQSQTTEQNPIVKPEEKVPRKKIEDSIDLDTTNANISKGIEVAVDGAAEKTVDSVRNAINDTVINVDETKIAKGIKTATEKDDLSKENKKQERESEKARKFAEVQRAADEAKQLEEVKLKLESEAKIRKSKEKEEEKSSEENKKQSGIQLDSNNISLDNLTIESSVNIDDAKISKSIESVVKETTDKTLDAVTDSLSTSIDLANTKIAKGISSASDDIIKNDNKADEKIIASLKRGVSGNVSFLDERMKRPEYTGRIYDEIESYAEITGATACLIFARTRAQDILYQQTGNKTAFGSDAIHTHPDYGNGAKTFGYEIYRDWNMPLVQQKRGDKINRNYLVPGALGVWSESDQTASRTDVGRELYGSNFRGHAFVIEDVDYTVNQDDPIITYSDDLTPAGEKNNRTKSMPLSQFEKMGTVAHIVTGEMASQYEAYQSMLSMGMGASVNNFKPQWIKDAYPSTKQLHVEPKKTPFIDDVLDWAGLRAGSDDGSHQARHSSKYEGGLRRKDRKQNRDIMYEYFKGKGLSDEDTAAIIGNFGHESNYDPSLFNSAGEVYGGIAQWRDNGNERRLSKLVEMYGMNPTLTDELDYAWWELTEGDYKHVLQKMSEATNLDEKTEIFRELYEGGGKTPRRQEIAQNVFDLYGPSEEKPKDIIDQGRTKYVGDIVNIGDTVKEAGDKVKDFFVMEVEAAEFTPEEKQALEESTGNIIEQAQDTVDESVEENGIKIRLTPEQMFENDIANMQRQDEDILFTIASNLNPEQAGEIRDNLNNQLEQTDEIVQSELENWYDSLNEKQKKFVYEIGLNTDTSGWDLTRWKQEVQKASDGISDYVTLTWEDLFDIDADGNVKANAVAVSKVMQGVSKEVREEFSQLIEDVENGTLTIEQAASQFELYSMRAMVELTKQSLEVANKDAFSGIADNISGLIDTAKELSATLDDVAGSMDLVYKAQQQMNSSGQISVKTALELMSSTDQWSQVLDVSNGKIMLAADAEQILIQSKLDLIKTNIETALQEVNTSIAIMEGAMDSAEAGNIFTQGFTNALIECQGILVGVKASLDAFWAGENIVTAFNNARSSTLSKIKPSEDNLDNLKQRRSELEKQRDILENIDTTEEFKNNYDYDKTPGDKYSDKNGKSAFELMQERHQNEIASIEHRQDLIQGDIDILEAQRKGISSDYYKQLINGENQKMDAYERQLKDAKDLLATTSTTDEEYNDIVEHIWDIEKAMQDTAIAAIDAGKAMVENWTNAADAIKEAYDNFNSLADLQKESRSNYANLLEEQGHYTTKRIYEEQNSIIQGQRDAGKQQFNELYPIYEILEQGGENPFDPETEKDKWEMFQDAAARGTIAVHQDLAKLKNDDIALTVEQEKNINAWKDTVLQAFDDVRDAYETQHQFIEDTLSMTESYISRMETWNINIPDAVIEDEIEIQAALNVSKGNDLDQALQDLAYLEKEVGTEDPRYIEAANKVIALSKDKYEGETKLIQLEQQIIDNQFDRFNQILDRIDDAIDDLDNVSNLISDEDVATEDGEWTNEGLTRIGIEYQKMEYYKGQIESINEEIAYYDDLLAQGKISEKEHAERTSELNDKLWDNVNGYKASEDAIVDLNEARVDIIENGLNKEIEAYSELIDLKKSELDAERDLYEFRKNVEEQANSIAEIERKMASISNSSSAEDRAEYKRLQKELNDANRDLDDTYRDHAYDQTSKALDNELETFEKNYEYYIEGLREEIKNTDELIQQTYDNVVENGQVVLETITQLSDEYGVQIDGFLTQPWINAQNETLNLETSVSTHMAAIKSNVETTSGELSGFLKSPYDQMMGENGTLADFTKKTYGTIEGVRDKAILEQDALHSGLYNGFLDSDGVVGLYQTGASNAIQAVINQAVLAKDAIGQAHTALNDFLAAQSVTKVDNAGGGVGGGDQTPKTTYDPPAINNDKNKKEDTNKQTKTDKTSGILSNGYSISGINAISWGADDFKVTLGGKTYNVQSDIYWNGHPKSKQIDALFGGQRPEKKGVLAMLDKKLYVTDAYGTWADVRDTKDGKSLTDAFFKKLNGYAKGTLGTKKDELAITDESWIGEEITLAAGKTGHLQYLKKGSAVLPADISENLMEWGKLSPDNLNGESPIVNISTTKNSNVDIDAENSLNTGIPIKDELPDLQIFDTDDIIKSIHNVNHDVDKSISNIKSSTSQTHELIKQIVTDVTNSLINSINTTYSASETNKPLLDESLTTPWLNASKQSLAFQTSANEYYTSVLNYVDTNQENLEAYLSAPYIDLTGDKTGNKVYEFSQYAQQASVDDVKNYVDKNKDAVKTSLGTAFDESKTAIDLWTQQAGSAVDTLNKKFTDPQTGLIKSLQDTKSEADKAKKAIDLVFGNTTVFGDSTNARKGAPWLGPGSEAQEVRSNMGANAVVSYAKSFEGEGNVGGKFSGGRDEAWCADFATGVIRTMGYGEDVIPTTASVAVLYDFFKRQGRLSDEPKKGALVMFNWYDDGYPFDHVGLVDRWDDDYIYTIEGNTTGGKVASRRHLRDSKTIIGYGLPRYANGTLGTKKDQWAITDEPQYGDELVIVPNAAGNLSFMRKGTSVVPADITKRIMELAQMPMNELGNNIINAVVPNIETTNQSIQVNFESLVKADNITNDVLPEVEKLVEKQLNKFTKDLNYSLKKVGGR